MDETLQSLVWSRAQGCCEYCQMPQAFDVANFEIDHIVAIQHRGLTEAANLALACYRCNRRKGPNIAGFDDVTGRTTPLFHPRRHKWAKHFRWNGPVLIGLTRIGRVTIHVLAINDDELRIALRRALIQERVFPPKLDPP